MSELTGSAAEVVDAVDLTVAPARDAVRPLVGRLRVIGIGAALAGATLLAAIRVKPQVWGDPGVWLSVGAETPRR